MKRFLLFLAATFLSIFLFAGHVSWHLARKAALNHYLLMAEKAGLKLNEDPVLNLSLTYTNGKLLNTNPGYDERNLFYVFNVNENDGFVIVSADDVAFPILGYSLKGNYSGDNLPPALQGLLERRAEEMIELFDNKSSTLIQVKEEWMSLLAKDGKIGLKSFTAVNPLLSTIWDQAPFYNDLCPYDYTYNELTVTGCPATAMAQIMKYWSYPASGIGYHSYNSENYGTLSANFEATTYEWNSMPNSLNSPNNAIATLMYHCGVSVEMQYGVAATGGSGGYVIEAQSPIQHCCEYAFKTYFGYKSTLQGLFRDDYNDATWIQMLKSELDAGRPLQYAGFGQGGGHTWVCDGYDNNNYFHMNWGWGGTYDGFYSLNSLSPGTGGAGGGSGSFNAGQQALIGIEPASGGSGSTQFDLRAYSDIFVDPFPIEFTSAFDVTLDIGNFDDSNFSGSLAAALFNDQGNFVEMIDELSGISLQPGYYDGYTFHTDGMLATPGYYYIGIYYKYGNQDWAIIGSGEYANYVSVQIVGPSNEMEMYSAISLNPSNITAGESFQIEFQIVNYGGQDYSGLVSADLYDSEGTYLKELAITQLILPSSMWAPVQFDCQGVDVPSGSYILAIWETKDAQNWYLVGSSDYPNPITIPIAAPQIPVDMYENNDSEQLAYLLPLNIQGGQAVITTEGSNIHTGNDMDFYKLDLPSGFQYKITPRAHDSYNSGNGITYTDDVLWAFGAGGNWTEVYDDVLDGFFAMEGGQTVYFGVSNYYQGQTGTYLLEILVEKGTWGVNEFEDPDLLTIYPNPSTGILNLFSKDWSRLGLITELNISDMAGHSVYYINDLRPIDSNLSLDLRNLKAGIYYMVLSGNNGYIYKKLSIIK